MIDVFPGREQAKHYKIFLSACIKFNRSSFPIGASFFEKPSQLILLSSRNLILKFPQLFVESPSKLK